MNMNGMNRGGWVGVEALKGGKKRQRTYIVGSRGTLRRSLTFTGSGMVNHWSVWNQWYYELIILKTVILFLFVAEVDWESVTG